MTTTEYPCRCCCNFVLTLGLSALFLWLSLRSSNPTASIETFSLPALNSSNSSIATSHGSSNISFLLKLNNPNKDKGINYDDLHLTFSLLSNQSHPTPVANYTVPGFYQGHKKNARKNGTVGTEGVDWIGVIARNGNENGTKTAFRVDLETRVRFKIVFWRTKRYGVRVGGVVEVDDMGDRVKAKKGVKLKSGAAGMHFSVRVLGLVGFLVLGFLDLGR